MATRVLLGFLVFVGVTGAIKDINGGRGDKLIMDFTFIAIGAFGLWVMRKDKIRW